MSEPADLGEDRDPLLVRPYISDNPAPTGTTWPASAAKPARHAATHRAGATTPIALPAGPGAAVTPTGRRRILIVAGAAAAVLIALAVTAYLVLRPGGSTRQPAVALPSFAPTGSPAPDPASSAPGALLPVPSAGPTATGSSPAATTSAVGVPPTTTAAAPGPKPATKTAPSSPPATLSAAPAADRVATIFSAAGNCLDLNGGVTTDGNHVQIAECNGTDAQKWTLAADGTLRVRGRCAQETGDTSVRIIGCDSRASAQWRTGANRAIVNVGANQCLTDPQNGANLGRALVVQPCTGGAAQQWTLS